jgi:hypothetical protein
MSWIECGSCEEMVDVCGGAVHLPYICGRCEKDAALASDTHPSAYRGVGEYPRTAVPCQSSLDSTQGEHFDMLECAADVINDLKMQLSQANLNIQIQEEIVEDLEGTIEILKSELRGISIRANDAALDTTERG